MDHLELAEDPLSFEEIYYHKYFQLFSYFISQDHKLAHHKFSSVWTYWNILCSPQTSTLLIMFKWHSRSGGMLCLIIQETLISCGEVLQKGSRRLTYISLMSYFQHSTQG